MQGAAATTATIISPKKQIYFYVKSFFSSYGHLNVVGVPKFRKQGFLSINSHIYRWGMLIIHDIGIIIKKLI